MENNTLGAFALTLAVYFPKIRTSVIIDCMNRSNGTPEDMLNEMVRSRNKELPDNTMTLKELILRDKEACKKFAKLFPVIRKKARGGRYKGRRT